MGPSWVARSGDAPSCRARKGRGTGPKCRNGDEGNLGSAGQHVALRTFYAALEGDIAATREIREAIEGKSTIRTDEERPPISINVSAIPQFRIPVKK